MMTGQLSVSSSSVGSPATIARMLDFMRRHDIGTITETAYFDEVNEAIARLRAGDVFYRLVLRNR